MPSKDISVALNAFDEDGYGIALQSKRQAEVKGFNSEILGVGKHADKGTNSHGEVFHSWKVHQPQYYRPGKRRVPFGEDPSGGITPSRKDLNH